MVDAEVQIKWDLVGVQRWERDLSLRMRNDLRITGIGRFLRRTSLDEIPSHKMSLKGDMSLVGPRPPSCYLF